MAYGRSWLLILSAMITIPFHLRRATGGLLAVLFFLLACSDTSLSAETSQPFSNLRIGFSGSMDVANGTLGDYYSPEPGFELHLQMPFYKGVMLIGHRRMRYKADGPNRPDMKSAYTSFGWGYEFQLPLHAAFIAGAAFGSFTMNGDEDQLPSYEKRWAETEYGTSLEADLRWSFSRNISLHVTGSHVVIYTMKRLHMTYITAGLSYKMTAPKLLREFLQ